MFTYIHITITMNIEKNHLCWNMNIYFIYIYILCKNTTHYRTRQLHPYDIHNTIHYQNVHTIMRIIRYLIKYIG